MISNDMKRTCQQSLYRKKMTDLRKYDAILVTGIGTKRNCQTKKYVSVCAYISHSAQKREWFYQRFPKG